MPEAIAITMHDDSYVYLFEKLNGFLLEVTRHDGNIVSGYSKAEASGIVVSGYSIDGLGGDYIGYDEIKAVHIC